MGSSWGFWIALVTTIGGVITAIITTRVKRNKEDASQRSSEEDKEIEQDTKKATDNVAFLVSSLVKETMEKCSMLQEDLKQEKQWHENTKKEFNSKELDRALELQKIQFELIIAESKAKELTHDLKESNRKLEEALTEVKRLNARVEQLEGIINGGR